MPTPSLLIVPSRWKPGSPGKLYSQIPTNGNGDFNVTGVVTGGTSIGTRVNNIGYIEPITTSGTPRLDYYTSSGTPGCPALLVEPAGTNLAFHSSDWTSNWNAGIFSGTTVVTNSAISLAPDGTATANEIHPTSGNTNHIRSSNSTPAVTYVSGNVYTQSAFFKAGIGVGIQVQLHNPTALFAQLGYANFDLINGLVSVVSGTTADTNRAARIENYGNGWYRCSYSATCTASGTGGGVVATLIAASGNTRNPSFSGTVTDYLLGWGAQLEVGFTHTSYIPTTTGSVTRNADVVSVTGVSSLLGQTSGTFYLDISYALRGTSTINRWLELSSATNNIGLAVHGTDSVRSIVNGQSDILTTPSTALGIKIAWGYDGSGVVLFVNGTQYTLTNGGAQVITSLDKVLIDMSSTAGTRMAYARIRAAALYTTRLSNADLTLLTMPGNNTYLPQAVWNNYLSRTGNTEVPDCLYTRHADLLDV